MRIIVAFVVALCLLLYPFSFITVAADSKEAGEKMRDEIVAYFASMDDLPAADLCPII